MMGVLFNAISQAQQLQLTAGEHILSGSPTASATKALLRLGNPLVGGDADGTYLGINVPNGYAGDVVNLQLNGVSAARVNSAGDMVLGTNPVTTFTRNSHTDRVNLGLAAPGNNTIITYLQAASMTADFFTKFQSIYDGTFSDQYVLLNAELAAGSTRATTLINVGPQGGGYIRHRGSATDTNRIGFGCTTTGGAAAADHLSIHANGKIGIGTSGTAPAAKLFVQGVLDEIQLGVRANATQTTDLVQLTTSGGTQLIGVTGAGFVEVGNVTADSVLHFASSFAVGLGRTALIRAVGGNSGAGGNNILFGHANTSLLNSIGATSGGGFPFLGFYCYHSSTANTLARSSGTVAPCRIISTSTGALAIEGAAAGTVDTDIAFTNWMHFQAGASGQVTIGNSTANLAKLAIVGGADEVQLLVRANSSQTANQVTVQSSGGTSHLLLSSANVFTVHNTGGTAQLTFAPAGGCGMFIANQSGQNLTVTSVADSNKIICSRARSAQTGNLFEAQLNAVVGSGDFQLWAITSGGDMTFNRTSSTTSGRQTATIESGFVSATDASRTGFLQLRATDASATRTFLRGEADGTNPRLGLLGATPIARPASYTVTGVATRTFPTDPNTAFTGIDNAQAGTPYAQVSDLNILRLGIRAILGVLRQIVTDVGSTSGYGLLAHS